MQRINEDIKTGNFKQIYLLYGEERYLRRQYRDRLKSALCQEGDTMNVHFYEGKDMNVGEVVDLAETLPFFADRRVIFVENSGLFKSGGERMAEYLAAPNETSFFVFTESEVDKRSKLYKTVQSGGCVVEFAAQDENTLKRWIAGVLKKEGKRIAESTVNLFLQKTGTDMDNIYMELEKLICYTMGREVITKEDVEAIGTVHVTNRIFEMVSAIVAGNTRKAMDLYEDLLTLKEPPMRILFLIAKQFNQLLQVKELMGKGSDKGTIASRIKVPAFAAGKLMAQAKAFSKEQILSYVELCVESEEAVKTGRLTDRMAVELLIARKY